MQYASRSHYLRDYLIDDYLICIAFVELFSEEHSTTSLLRTYPNTAAKGKTSWEKPSGLVQMTV